MAMIIQSSPMLSFSGRLKVCCRLCTGIRWSCLAPVRLGRSEELLCVVCVCVVCVWCGCGCEGVCVCV